jgi:hypothetical protein
MMLEMSNSYITYLVFRCEGKILHLNTTNHKTYAESDVTGAYVLSFFFFFFFALLCILATVCSFPLIRFRVDHAQFYIQVVTLPSAFSRTSQIRQTVSVFTFRSLNFHRSLFLPHIQQNLSLSIIKIT